MPFYAFSNILQNDQLIGSNRIFNLPHDFNERSKQNSFCVIIQDEEYCIFLSFVLMKRSFESALNIENKTSFNIEQNRCLLLSLVNVRGRNVGFIMEVSFKIFIKDLITWVAILSIIYFM